MAFYVFPRELALVSSMLCWPGTNYDVNGVPINGHGRRCDALFASKNPGRESVKVGPIG